MLEAFEAKFGPAQTYSNSSEIKFICPNCHKRSLACNLDSGLYRCWLDCGIKGQIHGAATSNYVKPKINLELQLQICQHILDISELSKLHKSVLNKRGIWRPERYGFGTVPFGLNQHLESKFGLSALTDAGFLNKGRFNWAFSVNRLIIPYLDSGKLVAIKTRANDSDMTDSSFRYGSLRGANFKGTVWQPHSQYWKPNSDVILTEGELAACAGCESGITSCGFSGLSNAESVCKPFNKLCESHNANRKFIIIDTDAEMFDRVANIKAAITLNKLIPGSTISFLPAEPGYSVDLDYYLNKYGPEKLLNILEDSWINRQQYKKDWTSIYYRIQKEKQSSNR